MILLLLVSLNKSMFFLRIIRSFSYIVTMINNVIYDLRVFMIFFMIMIVLFSMAMDVVARNEGYEYKLLSKFLANFFS